MHQRPVREFVVDDHAVVRRGLRAYLEIMAISLPSTSRWMWP